MRRHRLEPIGLSALSQRSTQKSELLRSHPARSKHRSPAPRAGLLLYPHSRPTARHRACDTSNVKSSILTAILASFFSLFGLNQPTSYHPPYVPNHAVVAAVALATSNQPASIPPAHTPASSVLPKATSDQTTLSPFVKSTASVSPNSQIEALENQFAAAVNALAGAVSLLRVQNTSTAPDVQQQLDALQSAGGIIDNYSGVLRFHRVLRMEVRQITMVFI